MNHVFYYIQIKFYVVHKFNENKFLLKTLLKYLMKINYVEKFQIGCLSLRGNFLFQHKRQIINLRKFNYIRIQKMLLLLNFSQVDIF